jgi:hypothetical protein
VVGFVSGDASATVSEKNDVAEKKNENSKDRLVSQFLMHSSSRNFVCWKF